MNQLSIETQRRLFCAGIARTNDMGVAAPRRGSPWFLIVGVVIGVLIAGISIG
jgi:hypothetical protein